MSLYIVAEDPWDEGIVIRVVEADPPVALEAEFRVLLLSLLHSGEIAAVVRDEGAVEICAAERLAFYELFERERSGPWHPRLASSVAPLLAVLLPQVRLRPAWDRYLDETGTEGR